MKQFSRILLVALALVLTLTMTGLAEDTELVVGTNAEFAPFEFVGDDGQPTGIDMDLMGAIGEKIGMTIKIENMSFDALIPSLTSGKIEAAISGMTITEERKQSVLFSDPYYQASQKIIVKADSAIKVEADLAGKHIGVQMGTTGDLYVTDNVKDATVERFDKGMDAVQDLLSGRLDAVVIDEEPANVFVSQAQGLIVLPDRLSDEAYGIALPLGQDELLAKINTALAALKTEGKLDEIYAKYKTAS
jgi:arginine/lysine/histidine transporter system substrate-binding protein